MKDLNVRSKIAKHIKKNSMLFDIGLTIWFWICLLKQGKQEQINKWDCIKVHQTEKLLYSEEVFQENENTSYWIEDFFTNDIFNKGLIKYTKNGRNSLSETTSWAKNGQMTWADIYTQKEMAKKHMKKCSTSLIIKEMHVKMTMRYSLTLGYQKGYHQNKTKEQQQQKKKTQIISVAKNVDRKRTPLCTINGIENCSHHENSMAFLQNTKSRACIWSSNFTSGYIPKESKTPMFTAALFTMAKLWKHSKCPSVFEWIKKLRHRHTHTCAIIIQLLKRKEK